ncbi:hypothetical protein [Enterococcus plantarum]|uniref:hypothetical protein n=1 Tax=Enterococcus plantarum TaxID=1077675 RepID=UPI001A8FB7F3|nr:hypothetical protein [Enterococcus plantarum]MBO0421374.1 hypothetical protein [Enterococcus plantarum]
MKISKHIDTKENIYWSMIDFLNTYQPSLEEIIMAIEQTNYFIDNEKFDYPLHLSFRNHILTFKKSLPISQATELDKVKIILDDYKKQYEYQNEIY